jgi:hypothetical protein
MVSRFTIILCTMICCCLPCIISILTFHEDMDMNRSAAAEETNALVAYKFQSMKIRDGDVVQDGGGISYFWINMTNNK